MSTYLQTVSVDFPHSEMVFHSMESAPICPSSYKPENNNHFIVMKTTDKSIITWWKNGSIVKVLPNGTIKSWFPKPTLKTAIEMCLFQKDSGFYIQLHPDSSVTCRFPDGNYYWSATIEGKPEVGEQVFGYDYDIHGPEEDEEEDSLPPKCYECYERSK